MHHTRKLGVGLGLALLAGGFLFIFHPTTVGWHPVILWESPYGPLGSLFVVLGILLTVWGLPPASRPSALGFVLVLCGVAYAFGFSFNWFYDWFYSTGPPGQDTIGPFTVFTVVVAACCAAAGGFVVGYKSRIARRWGAIPLMLVACLALFFLILHVAPAGYESYRHGYFRYPSPSFPHPEGLPFVLVPLTILSGLFLAFTVGLMRRKLASAK